MGKIASEYSRTDVMAGSVLTLAAHYVACDAHRGQVDQAGARYVDHPIAVGRALAPLGRDTEAAGYLHDVIEDTTITADDLLDAGFSQRVVRIVEVVSRPDDGRSYLDFIRSIASATNDIRVDACLVKLADNLHNSSPSRLTALPETRRESLARRYAAAREILTPEVDEGDAAWLQEVLWRV